MEIIYNGLWAFSSRFGYSLNMANSRSVGEKTRYNYLIIFLDSKIKMIAEIFFFFCEFILETFPLEDPVILSDDIKIRPELEHCESHNNSIWLGKFVNFFLQKNENENNQLF